MLVMHNSLDSALCLDEKEKEVFGWVAGSGTYGCTKVQVLG